MGPARTSATMWSAASPDGAVRGSRLDLPPLTVWSTSSIPRPDLPPHRRRCLQLAVAGHHDSLLQFFQRSFQRCNRGYVVAAEPSSDTSVVMPPGAFSCLSGPSPSVHASSCKQPQPPSVPRWWGFPVLGRTTPGRRAKPHPLLSRQLLWHLKSAPVVDLSVIVGSQQAHDKHAARD